MLRIPLLSLALGIILTLLLINSNGAQHQAQPLLPQYDVILKAEEEDTYTVLAEVAMTPPQLYKGLMFRKGLAEKGGMLLAFPKQHHIAVWTKNVAFPVDVLFIDRDGVLVNVAEHAPPMSEEVIKSRFPAKFVLKIRAGTIARIGVRVGGRVTIPEKIIEATKPPPGSEAPVFEIGIDP